MNTIRIGSSGDDVKKWQSIIGVTADGNFGPATLAATKEWQSSKKLVADGIVGQASWSMALGKAMPTVVSKTPQAGIDNQAYEVAKKAAPRLGMDDKQVQYVLAVARGEGFYGRGWNNPNVKTIEVSKQFGLTGYEGAGSNNWGAVQGTGNAGSFLHIDYHANGEPYKNPYRKYLTPEDGFVDMAKIILNGGKRGAIGKEAIEKAIDKGTLREAVFAQHDNGYFELAPEKYLEAVMRNYDILTANTEWTKLLSEMGKGILGKIGGMVLGFLLVGAGLFAVNKLRS